MKMKLFVSMMLFFANASLGCHDEQPKNRLDGAIYQSQNFPSYPVREVEYQQQPAVYQPQQQQEDHFFRDMLIWQSINNAFRSDPPARVEHHYHNTYIERTPAPQPKPAYKPSTSWSSSSYKAPSSPSPSKPTPTPAPTRSVASPAGRTPSSPSFGFSAPKSNPGSTSFRPSSSSSFRSSSSSFRSSGRR